MQLHYTLVPLPIDIAEKNIINRYFPSHKRNKKEFFNQIYLVDSQHLLHTSNGLRNLAVRGKTGNVRISAYPFLFQNHRKSYLSEMSQNSETFRLGNTFLYDKNNVKQTVSFHECLLTSAEPYLRLDRCFEITVVPLFHILESIKNSQGDDALFYHLINDYYIRSNIKIILSQESTQLGDSIDTLFEYCGRYNFNFARVEHRTLTTSLYDVTHKTTYIESDLYAVMRPSEYSLIPNIVGEDLHIGVFPLKTHNYYIRFHR